MNWPISLLMAVIAFSFIAPHLGNAQERPSDMQMKALLQERIDTARAGVGIVVGLIDEKGARVISHGVFSRTNSTQVDAETVFEIGSVTKVFTTELLAQMVVSGEVGLDDPVAQFLPIRMPERKGRHITLRDLATHHSGLPRLPDNMVPADDANPYADYSVEQMYAFLSRHTLRRDIGAKYEYSNLGMGLLGHALALKAGKEYEALVIERLCRPLGMTNTSITLSGPMQKRLATGHSSIGTPVSNWDMAALAGAGAFRSSASDMIKFVAANLKLEHDTLKRALEMTHAPQGEVDANTRIGLGWHIAGRHDTEIIWHNGGTGGYRSFIGFDKKSQRGVVVLSNSQNEVDDIGLHWLQPKYRLANISEITKREIVPVTAAMLDRYVGRYQLTPQMFFNVRRRADHLQVQLTGQSYLDIYPESETKFFCDVVDAQVSFQTDSQGKIVSLTLHQNGVNQVAKKISDEAPKELVVFKVDPKIYDAYAGNYQLTPDAVFIVERRENRLLVKLSGQPYFEVFPESETKYFYRVVDARITFVKNAQGEVTALILHQNGLNQEAKRLK